MPQLDFMQLTALGALIIIVVFGARAVWHLIDRQQTTITNHMSHNTEALVELKDAVHELTSYLRDSREHRA